MVMCCSVLSRTVWYPIASYRIVLKQSSIWNGIVFYCIVLIRCGLYCIALFCIGMCSFSLASWWHPAISALLLLYCIVLNSPVSDRTAMYCIALNCHVLIYIVSYWSVVYCIVSLYAIPLCCLLLFFVVLFRNVLHCIALWCVTSHLIVLLHIVM